MRNLLRIDSSARTTASLSRVLGDHLESCWARAEPAGRVVRRDLAKSPIGQIEEATITGFYTPADAMTPDLKAATALSDQLIAELQATDALLITTPMYNLSVPAALKAWIDQIVRVDRTFAYEDGQFAGLVKPDLAYVCAAYGANGYEAGGPMAAANFLEPYLDGLLRFLGFSQVQFFSLQATGADEATVAAGLAGAKAEIDRFFDNAP